MIVRRRWRALGAAAVSCALGCSPGGREATPAAPPATAAERPPPGPPAPAMRTAPWPTLEAPRPLPPTVPMAFPTPSYGSFGGSGAQAAVRPAPSPDDARIRAALNGTWEYALDEASPDGRNMSSRCRLVVTPAGATETCRSVTTLASTDPGWSCRTTRDPHVRVTEAPYAVSVTGADVLFSPGAAQLVSDNACTPQAAGSHTTMTASWDGRARQIPFVNNGDATNVSVYVRVPR